MSASPLPDDTRGNVCRGKLQDFAEARLGQRTDDLPAGTGLRLATMADIPALLDITEWAASQAKREGLFLRMSETILAGFVHDGIVLLPVSGSKVLGYSNAMKANDDHPPFLAGSYREAPGLLFGTVLGPDARARGWHDRLIRIRMDIFRMARFASVQCTVSPFNRVSLGNLLAAGFRAYGLKDMLDGHPRFLLRHDFEQKVMPGALRRLALPRSGSLADHEALLSDGFVGVSLECGETSDLCYVSGSGQVRGG